MINICGNEGCGGVISPLTPRRKYCCGKCKRAAWAKHRRTVAIARSMQPQQKPKLPAPAQEPSREDVLLREFEHRQARITEPAPSLIYRASSLAYAGDTPARGALCRGDVLTGRAAAQSYITGIAASSQVHG